MVNIQCYWIKGWWGGLGTALFLFTFSPIYHLSIYLFSLSSSVYPSISIYSSIYLSTYFYISIICYHLSTSIYTSISLYPSIYICNLSSVCLSFCLSIIYFTSQLQVPLLPLFRVPHPLLSSAPNLFLLHVYSVKGRPPMDISKTWHQVRVRLSISPCIRIEQSNPVWGIGYPKLATESETASAPTVKSPTRNQATQLKHICRGPRLIPCSFPSCWLSLWELLWAYISWFCGFSYGILDPSDSYSPFSFSSAGFPELCIMFDCRSASVSISCWMKPLW